MAEIDRWHTRISNEEDIVVQDREGRKVGEGRVGREEEDGGW